MTHAPKAPEFRNAGLPNLAPAKLKTFSSIPGHELN